MNDETRLASLENRMYNIESRQAAHHTDIDSHERILLGDGKKEWGLVARMGVFELLAFGNFALLLILLVLSIVILTQVF